MSAALAGLVVAAPCSGLADPIVHRVEIAGFVFVPQRIALRPGDRVEWVNRDIAPHTATASDRSWSTEELGRGQLGVVRFSAPGTFPYLCRYHPNMRGEIVVVAD